MAFEMRDFVEEFQYKVMKTGLLYGTARVDVTNVVLDMISSQGVVFEPGEQSKLAQLSDDDLIEGLKIRMPSQSRRFFAWLKLQLEIIGSTTRRLCGTAKDAKGQVDDESESDEEEDERDRTWLDDEAEIREQFQKGGACLSPFADMAVGCVKGGDLSSPSGVTSLGGFEVPTTSTPKWLFVGPPPPTPPFSEIPTPSTPKCLFAPPPPPRFVEVPTTSMCIFAGPPPPPPPRRFVEVPTASTSELLFVVPPPPPRFEEDLGTAENGAMPRQSVAPAFP